MKNWNQILKTLLLTTIYCFGICVSALSIPFPSTQTIEHNNGQSDYLTTASKVHFIHTEQSENVLSAVSEYSFPNLKLPCENFCVISFSNESLFDAKFKHYKNHFKTLLIRHRKSDLIFPFHNFW